MKIIITDNQLEIEGKITVDQLADTLLGVVLTAMNQTVSAAEEQHPEQAVHVKETLYDMFNWKASTLLQTFIPDSDLRPDLTEVAIDRASREIMKEHVDKHEQSKKA